MLGCIESDAIADNFTAELRGRNKRSLPPKLAINLNLNLQLPQNTQPQTIPPAAQQAVQQMLQQVQQDLQQKVEQQVKAQMPVVGFEGWLQGGGWHGVDEWGSATSPAAGSGSSQ